MRGGATHQTNKMVILSGGGRIHHQVTNELGVCLAGGIETEGDLDEFVLQVTINGLRTATDLGGDIIGLPNRS